MLKKFSGLNMFLIVLAVLPVLAAKATFAEEDIRSGVKSEIDVANRNDGYIRARSKAITTRKLKLRIAYMKSDGANVVYDYDLNGNSDWEAYSLQSGNGKYTVSINENVDGTRYQQLQTVSIDVEYNREHAPFLVPAQNVNYSAESNVVKKAAELSSGAATDLEKL